MDTLTQRLQEAAEALPDAMPSADQLRHGAEHARRTRRVAAGSAAAALVAVLALGVGVLGGGARPQLAPAGHPPGAWRSSAGSVFTADPVMPEAGWVAISNNAFDALRHLHEPGVLPLENAKDIRMTADRPQPLACITDPHALGAAEVYGAAVLQPPRQNSAVPMSGRSNEYVLWFADPADAERAVAGLRQDFQDCRADPGPASRVDHSYLAYDEAVNPPIEEQFTAELALVPRSGEGDGFGYGVSVARLGSLIVVHESLEGWWERPTTALYAFLIYALDRVSPAFAPERFDQPDLSTS
jgi:hypothetical protein